MIRPARPKVRPWRWDLGKPTEQHGAQIRTGNATVFIPGPNLRTVADRLHDLADTLEAGQ